MDNNNPKNVNLWLISRPIDYGLSFQKSVIWLKKNRNPFCNEKDLFDKKSNQIKLQFVDERTYYSTIERM